MARSHRVRDIYRFAKRYLLASFLATVALLVYSYWDIIRIRYLSEFFGSQEISEAGEQLFARGFGKMLNQGFTELLPVLLTLVLSSLVAYTLYNSYKKTLRDLDVNHNFVNVDRTHSLHIALHHLVAYTASFTLPLLFWCFYLIMWFPAIARKPLSYILSSDVSSFALVSCLVVMFLVLLTQLGLVITRLAVRILK